MWSLEFSSISLMFFAISFSSNLLLFSSSLFSCSSPSHASCIVLSHSIISRYSFFSLCMATKFSPMVSMNSLTSNDDAYYFSLMPTLSAFIYSIEFSCYFSLILSSLRLFMIDSSIFFTLGLLVAWLGWKNPLCYFRASLVPSASILSCMSDAYKMQALLRPLILTKWFFDKFSCFCKLAISYAKS